MRNIDSYDSRYPLEYYEIGTIYSFYCSSIAGKFKKADSEYISKYSSKLLELQEEENTNVIQSVKTQSSKLFSKSLQRFYGIVIAKPRNVMLKVMFIGIHDGINNFFTKDNDITPLDKIMQGERNLYKFPQINWDMKTPNRFLNHVGGINFDFSKTTRPDSSRPNSGLNLLITETAVIGYNNNISLRSR